MGFRLGVIVGFGAGYYLGARAGRERYEDINRLLRKAKRSDQFETATDTARSVVDRGVDRAMDVIDSKVGGDGNEGSDTGSDTGGTTWPSSVDPGIRP
jgi:hypothetical protein